MDCTECCSGNPEENEALRLYHDGCDGTVFPVGQYSDKEHSGKTPSLCGGRFGYAADSPAGRVFIPIRPYAERLYGGNGNIFVL